MGRAGGVGGLGGLWRVVGEPWLVVGGARRFWWVVTGFELGDE